jgi:hypothetical protein
VVAIQAVEILCCGGRKDLFQAVFNWGSLYRRICLRSGGGSTAHPALRKITATVETISQMAPVILLLMADIKGDKCPD